MTSPQQDLLNGIRRSSFVIKIVPCLKTVSNCYLPYFSFLRCIRSKFVTNLRTNKISNPVPDLLVRTPREPQENLKRTPREPQEKQIWKRHFNVKNPLYALFVPREPQENPKRTPREPQENPMRTPREPQENGTQVPPSNFKEELEKNKTKAQVTGVLFGCLKL